MVTPFPQGSAIERAFSAKQAPRSPLARSIRMTVSSRGAAVASNSQFSLRAPVRPSGRKPDSSQTRYLGGAPITPRPWSDRLSICRDGRCHHRVVRGRERYPRTSSGSPDGRYHRTASRLTRDASVSADTGTWTINQHIREPPARASRRTSLRNARYRERCPIHDPTRGLRSVEPFGQLAQQSRTAPPVRQGGRYSLVALPAA